MNLTALPELLLSWVKNQGAALLQASDKTQAAIFQPGQQYDGKVVDNLPNGRHLVRVGNQMLDMNLPAKTQPGDSVRLTYLNAGPSSTRPTFLLNQAAVSSVQQVQISNTAQQVNALLRFAQTPAAATAVSASVNAATSAASPAPMAARSSAVRGGEAMLDIPKASAPPSSATVNIGLSSATTPLPSEVSVAATPFASARPIAANALMLQNYSAAIQPTTTALTGPNTGLLGQAVDAPRAAVSASTTLSANTLVELPAASRHMLPVRLSQTLSESGLFYESHLAKWSQGVLSLETLFREPLARLGQENPVTFRLAELGGMPEEAARMAGRQLQMLEGAPFVWQGMAWPGQTMSWLIREEAAKEGQGGDDETTAEWATELTLTLPRMGEVHAMLSLSGERLRLKLQSSDTTTCEAMAVALPLLVKGFEAGGLRPQEMQIEALPTYG